MNKVLNAFDLLDTFLALSEDGQRKALEIADDLRKKQQAAEFLRLEEAAKLESEAGKVS